eukprot:10020_1
MRFAVWAQKYSHCSSILGIRAIARTQKQKRTLERLEVHKRLCRASVSYCCKSTCFSSTTVQILTPTVSLVSLSTMLKGLGGIGEEAAVPRSCLGNGTGRVYSLQLSSALSLFGVLAFKRHLVAHNRIEDALLLGEAQLALLRCDGRSSVCAIRYSTTTPPLIRHHLERHS